MSNRAVIKKASTGETVLANGHWCKSFWCHFRGLMLRRSIAEDEALILVYRRTNISEAAIHMFFVFFPIAAVWLDEEKRVIDAKLAKPWRPFYAPSRPARYLIEAHPVLIKHVSKDDVLTFES